MNYQFSPYQYPTRQQLIRVNGLDGARAYQMGPNSTVALFDGNDDIMYIKSTDGAGFGTIRQFTFAPKSPATNDYVTREEFEALKGMIMDGKQSVRKQQNEQ